jgi:integrase
MAVRQRGNRWQGDVPGGKAFNDKRFRRSFATKEEAEVWEVEATHRIRRGLLPELVADPNGQAVGTIEEAYQATHARHWLGTPGERTAVTNGKAAVEFFKPTTPVSTIDEGRVDQWVAELKKLDRAPGTINRKLSALGLILRTAKARGWVQTLPTIARLKEAESRIRWLTKEEEARVFEYYRSAGDVDMVDLITVLLDAGLRLGEALGLVPTSIKEGKVWVWGDEAKGKKTRAVKLTRRLVDLFQRRGDNLFQHMTGNSVEWRWKKMRIALGFEEDEEFVPHALRHTFCTRLILKGVPVPVVQRLAGHADIATTMRYVHAGETDMDAAIERLEDDVLTLEAA